MIHTDAKGKPFERPEPPPDGASIEDKIAYMRAKCAYNDAITDCANKAFAKGFRP
jgi:hypothetical protein